MLKSVMLKCHSETQVLQTRCSVIFSSYFFLLYTDYA